MSKNTAHARLQCLTEWLEDLRKKQKYGFKKKKVYDPAKASGAEVETESFNQSFTKKRKR
jgi:hypothetical protein